MVLTTRHIVKNQFERTDTGLLINAPAKINLSLLIAGKRPDGFHEIETLMSKITWYDQVVIEPWEGQGVALECKGQYWAPEGDENLVLKAAKLISEKTNFNQSVKITLIKNIPAGTGLGSASSDAASTLLALNKYADLGLSKDQLLEMAASLGSDVPFFVGSPLAYCTGRGEKIREIESSIDFKALIITPNITVPTVGVYKNYKHDNELYSSLSSKINPCIEKMQFGPILDDCPNMLQTSCFDLHRDLKTLKEEISSIGLSNLHLSGSGSALFSILDEEQSSKIGQIQKILLNNFECQSLIVYNNRW